MPARPQGVRGQPLPGVRPQQDGGRRQADGVRKLLHDVARRHRRRSVGGGAKCNVNRVSFRARTERLTHYWTQGFVAIYVYSDPSYQNYGIIPGNKTLQLRESQPL